MVSPTLKKLISDLKSEKQRILLMVLAIAISVVGIGMSLGSYGITVREIGRNYLSTNPASATFEMTQVDAELVRDVEKLPGISQADRRAVRHMRYLGDEGWSRLLLMVVDDFDQLKLNTFKSEKGAWPPAKGTMLVERSSAALLGNKIPEALKLERSKGTTLLAPVSGTVHDPGLAPARTEQIVYGYVTMETFQAWEFDPVFEELRVRVSEELSAEQRKQEIMTLYNWLHSQGLEVLEIQTPPANRHPHAKQMEVLILLLVVFGFMSLILSSVLMANLISSLMGKHVRQIAVMKAIGAKPIRITGMYMLMIFFPALLAVSLAVFPGVLAAEAMADIIATNLNFNIQSYTIPGWVFLLQFSTGLLVPLMVALIPISRASRVTVMKGLADYGVNPKLSQGFFTRRVGGLAQIRLSPFMALVFKNTFRKQGRLLLTLALLGASGAMFMSSVNMTVGWQRLVDQVYLTRSYDVELRLPDTQSINKITQLLKGLPEVKAVEGWGYTSTSMERLGNVNLVVTYPDGGHGSFSILAPPPDTEMISYPIIQGRWLRRGDRKEVVVNQMVRNVKPDVEVGQLFQLSLGGQLETFHVVGIVEEIGSAAAAYISYEEYSALTNAQDRARLFRLSTNADSMEQREVIIRKIDGLMTGADIGVEHIVPLKIISTAIGEHVYILMGILIAMAMIMAAVGAIGLLASQGMNTLERTRELGVLKTIGARPKTILMIVVSEGLVTGALSLLFAFLLSIPFSEIIGSVVGNIAFMVALPRVFSLEGAAIWLGLALVVTVLASAVPAWRASRLIIREALSYE